MKAVLSTFHVIIFILFLSSCSGNKKTDIQKEDIDTIPMMVMQIQKCSRLYTTECQVHKIITHDDQKKLTGSFLNKEFSIDLPLGKRMVAIPMDATLKAYIDFADFSEKNIRRNGKKIQIILPDPKVTLTSTKIDHNAIKQYVALTRSNFSDKELTSYQKQGRDAIINDIPKLGIIDNARESAARTLIPMVMQMGYDEKDITVTFRKGFTLDDITGFIVTTPTRENGRK